MFKCQKCGKITQKGEKQHKKIIATRNKIYQYLDKYGQERTAKGWEIEKEINICEKCVESENRR